MSSAAEGKRPAPVEPEEGGGAGKRQKQWRDGGVAKPGNGAHKEEHTSLKLTEMQVPIPRSRTVEAEWGRELFA